MSLEKTKLQPDIGLATAALQKNQNGNKTKKSQNKSELQQHIFVSIFCQLTLEKTQQGLTRCLRFFLVHGNAHCPFHNLRAFLQI